MAQYERYGQGRYGQFLYGVGVTALAPALSDHYKSRDPKPRKTYKSQAYRRLKKATER